MGWFFPLFYYNACTDSGKVPGGKSLGKTPGNHEYDDVMNKLRLFTPRVYFERFICMRGSFAYMGHQPNDMVYDNIWVIFSLKTVKKKYKQN